MSKPILAVVGILGMAGWTMAGADLSAPPNSMEPVSGPVVAWVHDVIDGDTIAVRARIWLGQDVTTRVRLSGVDAPELKASCEEERHLASAARDFVRARVLETRVSLVDIHYDKYGRRVLARVVTATGEDLGESLIRRGLGRPYAGGARNGWCGGK
ncbi:MAG: nuclease [Alphaproteobacteria bacterium]|nr:nuclease [Alphaproteobacteria bacterium]